MPDTFLEAHRLDPLQFTISSPLTPISIRDQMVRAKMLVDRAIDENLIGVDRPLFVVGAGAGGVTAALYSAFRGVKTTIIELRDHAFALQRKCLTRWIDPTQYDWPASHWIQGIFPWVPPAMPLPWRAFPSNLIAATWTQELRSAIKKYPGLLQVHSYLYLHYPEAKIHLLQMYPIVPLRMRSGLITPLKLILFSFVLGLIDTKIII